MPDVDPFTGFPTSWWRAYGMVGTQPGRVVGRVMIGGSHHGTKAPANPPDSLILNMPKRTPLAYYVQASDPFSYTPPPMLEIEQYELRMRRKHFMSHPVYYWVAVGLSKEQATALIEEFYDG